MRNKPNYKGKNSLALATKLNTYIVYITLVCITIVSFLVRLKVFKDDYFNYDLSAKIQNSINIFTYYKLVFLVIFVAILFVIFMYKVCILQSFYRKDYVLVGVGLILLSGIISYLCSPLKFVSLWGFYQRTNGLLAYLALFLLLYIIANVKVEKKFLINLLYLVNGISIIYVIIGLFQFSGWEMFNADWFKHLYIPTSYWSQIDQINIKKMGSAAFSMFGQYNYFGAYCSIFYPLLLAFALNSSSVVQRIFFSLGSVMLFIGTIIADSAGSWYVVMLMTLIVPIFFVRKHNYKFLMLLYIFMITSFVLLGRNVNLQLYRETLNLVNAAFRNSKMLIALLLGFCIYAAILFYNFKVKGIGQKGMIALALLIMFIACLGYIYILGFVVDDHKELFTGRGYIWANTKQMLSQNYITGYGPDNFYYNFPQENEDKELYIQEQLIDKPHNMFLQIISDIGIFGLLGFLVLIIGYMIKCINKSDDGNEDKVIDVYLRSVILVITSYAIQGLVNDNHLTIQPMLYVVWGFGMAVAYKTPTVEIRSSEAASATGGTKMKKNKLTGGM